MDRDHRLGSASLTGCHPHGPAQSSDTPCPPSRELAERVVDGMHIRLLWRQGTSRVWVEVKEAATAWVLRIQVQPGRALDAFYHPYAYAGRRSSLSLAESLELGEPRPQAADEKLRGQ